MNWKLINPTWHNKGVLENLTISLNHWLVPKKPKPKDTFWQRRKKRFQRRFSWTHIKKNWQLFVFMGFIFTVNVILFVTRAVYFRWESLFNNSRERKIGRDLRIDFKADIEKYIQHTPYSWNIMRQKWEGDCGLWVLDEIILKKYNKSLKKIVGAV